MISACSNLSDNEEIIADLAVQSAAVRFIDGDQERAKKVLAATEVIRVAMTENPASTVLNLSNLAKEQVPIDRLTPQEVLLAYALIDLVVVEVTDKVPADNVLDPVTIAKVTHYLDQIEIAARLTLE